MSCATDKCIQVILLDAKVNIDPVEDVLGQIL